MAEQPPDDPAAHAEDFSRRYAYDLEILAGQVMLDLGLPAHRIGALDHERGSRHHCFFPQDREGGSVNTAGQVTLDSGLLNPELLSAAYREDVAQRWRRTRLMDRGQAIVAHELAEAECGTHELALIAAAETDLPVSPAARKLLLAMAAGWRPR